MVILEQNFKWHLEAFASELFIYFSLSAGFESLTRNCQNLTTKFEVEIDHKTISKVRKKALLFPHTFSLLPMYALFMGGFHNKITLNHVRT